MSPEDIMLSEISQVQKYKYCMISLIGGIFNRKAHRSREWDGGYQEPGGALGRCWSKETKFQLHKKKKFMRLAV
jgi:hypothetical protein